MVVAKRSLDVYATGPVAGLKGALHQSNGTQAGDVNKCASVIVDVFTGQGVGEGRDVPARLPLGSDTIEVVRKRVEDALAMIKEWEAVAALVDGVEN
jgi:hypothetical protein